MCDQRGRPTHTFNQQQYMFGKTPTEQLRRFEEEKNAYYDLVKTSSIKSIAHMCPVFEDGPD